MDSDKKICPKCGKECDIGDLYCSCNYKFSFKDNDSEDSITEDKSSYTEQLKKRVDNYSNEYHQYDSNPPESSYEDSNYQEPQPDGSGCGIVVLIIIVVVIVCALLGVFSSNNYSSNNSTYNNSNYNQNEETTNNNETMDYPSCDASTTLKPMKKNRTEALVSVFENSKYVLNTNYSLWYRNTQSEGEGNCKSEEMIKNLFFADPEVYIALPLNYKVYYENGQTYVEHQNYTDMDEIINKGTFYRGSHVLNNSEINTLLSKSLPEYSNSNSNLNNYNYENNSNYNYNKPSPIPTSNVKNSYHNNDYYAYNGGINWNPYMNELSQRIKANWYPPQGSESKRVVLQFSINKDGRLLDIKVIESSGIDVIDRAAINAVQLTAPFKPLPSNFNGEKVDISFTFDYNVH